MLYPTTLLPEVDGVYWQSASVCINIIVNTMENVVVFDEDSVTDWILKAPSGW